MDAIFDLIHSAGLTDQALIVATVISVVCLGMVAAFLIIVSRKADEHNFRQMDREHLEDLAELWNIDSSGKSTRRLREDVKRAVQEQPPKERVQ